MRATGWARDLAFGARLVLAGGRDTLLRTAMAAIGVGLGVALLLAGTSISTMLDERSDRTAARDYERYTPAPPDRGDRTLLVAEADTTFRDLSIRGRVLRADGGDPVLPPGVTTLPGPGELVLSPALGRLLAAPEGALLRPRLDHRVIGTISDAGLDGPNEYAYYLGSDRLEAGPGVIRIDHFGSDPSHEGLDSVLLILVMVIFVVLLLPIAVFIAAAARFGGDQRDRRLAAVRLVGADRGMARRIAAGEALLGAVLGLATGGVFFLVGRQFVERVTLSDISVFARDVRPSAALAALIVLAVPATAVGVVLLTLRRIVIEPLGVLRHAARGRRRPWWRLLLPVGGLALLAPLLRGDVSVAFSGLNQIQVITGVVLLLTGVAALLPWLVEAVMRRMGAGPVSWQLAVRRIQLNSETSARMVSGVAVAVAGGIALQMLFAGAQHNYVSATGHDVTRAQAVVTAHQTITGVSAEPLAQRFRAVQGVRGVLGTVDTELTTVGTPPDASGFRPSSPVRIGDCAALRELATLDRCADGDAFVIDRQPGEPNKPPLPRPGQQVEVAAGLVDRPPRWTVPADIRPAPPRLDPTGGQATGILATPGALTLSVPTGVNTTLYLSLDPARPDTIEEIRNAAARVGPEVWVQPLRSTLEDGRFYQIRQGLFIGVLATLLLLGASLLVGTLEQLRERRRLLAVLVAFGTRRSTLGWSVLWQTAIPMLLGLVLAVAGGTALGAALQSLVGEPVRLDWASLLGMSGIAAAVVLLVTLASLPALWRLLRPMGLRSE